ncbi:MAG: hypothetical protein M0P31_17660 [Solirubrobacteraceae bacterium]|nr:hypothetical protein [Solirubrobacteraceae bacterium]
MPVLVLGSLAATLIVSAAIGAQHPYPGVALGSGLLLVLERAIAIWALVLLTLVVGDQALRGRLPDEISGRGVRYATHEQLDQVAENVAGAGDDVADRIDDLEIALAELHERLERR